MTFSDKIKRAREVAGFTQQQLADQVGVSKRTIAAYESTDAKARPSTMRKLAACARGFYRLSGPRGNHRSQIRPRKATVCAKRSEQHVATEQPER